jgi:hypothetical protein
VSAPSLRPSGAPVRQAVLLLLDGIRPDVLQDLLAGGEVPSIARLFPDAGSRVAMAASAFPTTTGPAHLPFLTGRYPGPCNVPGIRWFDPRAYRDTAFSRSRFRSYMGPGALMVGRDIAPGISTIFDLVRSHAQAGGNIRRGLRLSRDLSRWSKLGEPVLSYFTQQWDRLDRRVGRAVADSAASGTAFIFAVFSSADSMGHKFGPRADATLDAYRRIDLALAPLAEHADRTRDGERPLVMLVSDHGGSDTRAHLDLERLVERVAGRCLAHPRVWRGLYGARSAVMVSGNAMAHVYLRGGDWEAPTLDQPSGAVSRLLEALLGERATDQVFGRSSTGGAVVIGRDGEARIEPTGTGIRYAVTRGRDPFGYPPSAAGTRGAREWLELTWASDYPDAPVQVLQILQSPRAGHLVVTARPGHDLRSRFERPPHAGSHGSLHREHMMTPLLSNSPLSGGRWRTVDVCPTILHALGVAAPAGLDGRSLWPVEAGPTFQ